MIHLDRHHWKPGWVETPAEEWRVLQGDLLAGDRWIVDGNYGGTFDVRFERADTVVVFNLPRTLCVVGALRRSLRHRGKAVQAEGCPERVDLKFLRWIWRYQIDSRPRLNQALAKYGDHLRIVELTSRRAAIAFLNGLAAD